MTEDEVSLIYEYLHENYEYRDGELISIKTTKGKKEGEKLGTFRSSAHHPAMLASINVLKKNYTRLLASFIYLYFKKDFHPRFDFIDGNITNTRIENLKIKVLSCSASLKRKNKGFLKETRGGKDVYRCLVSLKGKKISLGYYNSIEECIAVNKIAKKILSTQILTVEQVKKEVKKNYPNAKVRLKTKCLPGVHQRGKSFRATIFHSGKKIQLGSHSSEEEAHQAYLQAKQEYANEPR